MAYNEISDKINNGVVETYRDILTPVIEQSNSEGANSSSSSFGFGLLLCLIITGITAALLIMYVGVSIVATVIISLILFIVLFELIPFRLSSRLRDFKRMSKNMENTFKQLNKIQSINEDGTISVNNSTGILLECTTNYYLNLNNYTNDFDRYISLFHKFNISITGMVNIGKVNYVNLDKLDVYNDKVIKYERIKLAKQVRNEMATKSKVYIIYLFISTSNYDIENLLRTYKESLTSTYKRVFSKIELVTGNKLFEVLSRELLIPINQQNIYADRTKKTNNVSINQNIIKIKEI